MYRKLTFIAVLLFSYQAFAQVTYQKPPKEVMDILNAPATPTVLLSPTRERMALLQGERYPSIADLAEPMLKMGGVRFDPGSNGPHLQPRINAITIKTVAGGKELKLALPAGVKIGNFVWSPDGKYIAFTNTRPDGIELWFADAATGALTNVKAMKVNAMFGGFAGGPVEWLPDGKTLLCRTIPSNRGAAPPEPRVPVGPTVQESFGKNSPVRTYQDLLKNAHDEELFEFYGTSELAYVSVPTAKVTRFGAPGLYTSISPSPDGKFLLATRIHKPFSYLFPYNDFPEEISIVDRQGKRVHLVDDHGLRDQVPIEGVATGPRQIRWSPVANATLVWVEALDGGDQKKKVPFRDRVMTLAAPFNTPPMELVKTEHRFANMQFVEGGKLAWLAEVDRNRRWSRTFLLNLGESSVSQKVLFDRSQQDRYNDPGTPLMRMQPNGKSVIALNGDEILLSGSGASPKGDRPFLNRFNLKTGQTVNVFKCDDTSLESVVAILDPAGARFITRHESQTEPPNYFIRESGKTSREALTSFKDPAPWLRNVKKQLVRYKRADGVDLSFTLYLPPDYKEGQRLPTVVWAYPLEFTDAGTAGQVTGSTNRFTTLSGYTHLFFLTQGYAVLDDTTMPIVGDPETVNNTFVEQIISSARAAIDKAVEMGVTDRNRVGVGGHSYGAFMTANLLAHSDLFKAGIARSGAYNRTLTPFGFQSERRTIWEAPDMYLKVSPFMYANRIKTPILLIHGEADDNTGTFPIQSERLYQALKGNGGNVRYVTLPFEAHGYSSRESTEHVLWEMINWFNKYVKNSGVQTAGK